MYKVALAYQLRNADFFKERWKIEVPGKNEFNTIYMSFIRLL